MSIFNENISIKIKDVALMSWDISSVNVSERAYHALVFRISGSAYFSHGDFNTKTDAGDVFYMPANYSYKALYCEKNEIIVIHFESDLVSKMENFTLNNSHSVHLLFQKLHEVWSKKFDGYYFSALSIMCEILETISKHQAPVLNNITLSAFENAVQYMESHYTSNEFTITEMVKRAHMSNTYFRKLFFSKFGTSPSRFIILKRLRYAEKLLSTGKYSVKDVAEMSGITDVKYFSRVFKKEYGAPPSKLYRHNFK